MNVLNVSDLSKSFGGRTLFDRVSFAIDEEEKVGFIGVNGSGKSTLFKLVAGLETPDTGDLAIRRGAAVRYLSQEPDFTPGQSILETVAEGKPELRVAFADYESVTQRLAAPHADHDRLLARQGELAATIERLGGWDWTHRAEAMLTRLGITSWSRSVDDLSGGEAKRVALARTLLAQPELLLLDEPTNHLDADTVLFLEEYLIDYPGAVMLITHDRYFLDRVVDRMIEVSNGALTTYVGGYTDYLEAEAARAEREAVTDARRRKLIEQELDWARRSPPARTGKQRARIQRARSLEAESKQYRGKQTRELSLPKQEAVRLGRSVLDLHDVSKAYGNRQLIRSLDVSLRAGERIGVIGPNGAGKTTLIRIIVGTEPPDSGTVEVAPNTRIAYFDQLRSQLDPELSVYQAAGGTDWVQIGDRRVHLRSYLEDFLFPTDRQQQKVGSLSGGERNRLLLARLFMQPSNLLILDEPTNDLDLITLQVLEAAVIEYPGCVLMVTHDRFFLDKIATSLIAFEGDGVVRKHEGGYEHYRRLRDARAAEEAAAKAEREARQRAPRPVAQVTAATKSKLSWKEARELEALPGQIQIAEAERDALSARLGDPALYQDATEASRITAAFKDAEASVDALYARWTELEERAGS